MARRRASMREGPLAELFKKTEAAQKQAEQRGETPAEGDAPAQQSIEDTVVAPPGEPEERTVLRIFVFRTSSPKFSFRISTASLEWSSRLSNMVGRMPMIST